MLLYISYVNQYMSVFVNPKKKKNQEGKRPWPLRSWDGAISAAADMMTRAAGQSGDQRRTDQTIAVAEEDTE
jgi:hypothetical protein